MPTPFWLRLFLQIVMRSLRTGRKRERGGRRRIKKNKNQKFCSRQQLTGRSSALRRKHTGWQAAAGELLQRLEQIEINIEHFCGKRNFVLFRGWKWG
ncbi:hypothetical protein CEXT_291031 [Caerostris extrusa]|uniref:Secreted protein n=1 Tax=Caerostris extrusa TaxID=172846 RepID=A0AAV4NS78_CAEEX|nr:hypothetical protein CEXT_291031 [Caerostris extrusa]